jgi:glycine oxidase
MLNVGHLGGAADAAILGGGVVGLAAARELVRRGLSVALVERGRAAQSEADRADDFFRLACAARDAYPDFARALREETGVDIELDETGTLYLATTEDDAREIERRHDWQSRAGLAVERLTTEEARALEPRINPRALGALRFPRDWQVENTAALSVVVERGRAASVETTRGTIAAGAIVIACGAWSSQVRIKTRRGGEVEMREGVDLRGAGGDDASEVSVEPVRGQMLSFETGDGGFARHVIYGPRGYLVPRRANRLLAGSTTERAGFDKSVTDEGRALITKQAAELAPAVTELKLAEAWAGLRPRGADERPVVGESAEVENLFLATAHYRNGILLAPLTAALLAEAITERVAPPLLAPFSPAQHGRAAATHGAR